MNAAETPASEKAPFRIETASEDDWPWIVQGQAEIAWRRLGPERQQTVDCETVGQRVAQHIARLRMDAAFPTQAFVARGEDGALAGFVWVARTHHDFTGQLEASLLSQYVAEAYRRQGLGRRLMETAEHWAREQGLPRISLSVGTHNVLAQNLYKTLGFEVEALRMTKELTRQEPELALSDY